MSKYSITETKIRLSDLIACALKGERVVIRRNGCAVVELKPISRTEKPITPEAIEWLIKRRVGHKRPRDDAAVLVSKMRDEWKQ
jgi:antitoxin (DNA-binding transcriptional repressor) of toxin-antitoxin stability system